MTTSRTPTRATSIVHRLDNWILRAITGGAMLAAGLGVVAGVARAGELLGSESVTVSGMELANASTPEFTTGSPLIVEAHYETLRLTVEGLSGAARGWLVATDVFGGLLATGLCLIVAWLGMRVLTGRPFAKSLTWGTFAAAILVIVTGAGNQLAAAIARAEVVDFLGDDMVASGGTEGFYYLMMTLDPAPFAWGIGLAVLTAAFQIGERLQRDTEGLV